MKKTICAICKTNRYATILFRENISKRKITSKIFSARRTPDRIHYQLLLCKKCGLIFSSPIFPIKRINTLYKGSTFTYSDESKLLAKTYGNYLKKILAGKKPDTVRL